MVEVVHGPLKGVVGRLLRKGAHARLMLAVDLIGQAVSVEVDAADVKAVLNSGRVNVPRFMKPKTRQPVESTKMKIGSINSRRRSRWPRWRA